MLLWNANQPPSKYAPNVERRFSLERLEEMYSFHALPEVWYDMSYFPFLEERRKRIAAIIRKGFQYLSDTGAVL